MVETLAGSNGEPLQDPATPTDRGVSVIPADSWFGRLRGFWIAAVGLLVVLAGLIPVLGTPAIAVPDDGVYAAQAALLSRGSWSERRPAAPVDDNGVHSSIGADLTYRDRQIPYLKHPLLPTTLGRFFAAGGFGGLLVFSVLGTWSAAVATGLMARRLDRRYGIPALVLTGVGTPLVFDAYLVSAHAMAAGLCGLVALGVAQVVEDRRWRPLIFVLPSAALVVGLRSEGTVAMVAFAVVVGLLSVRVRPWRIDRRAATTSIGLAATTVLAYFIDGGWTRSIESAAGGTVRSLVRTIPGGRDPLGVVWISLIRPGEIRAGSTMPAVVLGLIATVLAAVVVKVAPRRWLLPLTLTVVSTLGLVVQQMGTPWMVTGLAATFPLLPAGLILLHRHDLVGPMVVRNLGVAGLTVLAVTATTYSEGGAAEWGGRFYHLVIPLLVPVVVLGLHRGYSALDPTPARVIAASVLLGALLTSLIGLRYIAHARHQYRATIDATAAFVTRTTSTDHSAAPGRRPVVVVVPGLGGGMRRMYWESGRPYDTLYDGDSLNADRFIDRLRQDGYPAVTVVTNLTGADLAILDTAPPQGARWGARRIERIPGTGFTLIEFGPATTP